MVRVVVLVGLLHIQSARSDTASRVNPVYTTRGVNSFMWHFRGKIDVCDTRTERLVKYNYFIASWLHFQAGSVVLGVKQFIAAFFVPVDSESDIYNHFICCAHDLSSRKKCFGRKRRRNEAVVTAYRYIYLKRY